MMWLFLWGCTGGNSLDDAWVGFWQVDSHLDGEGCGFPVEDADPQWEGLQVEFLDLQGVVAASVARCDGGGNCDDPAIVVPLEILEADLMVSTQANAALVAGPEGAVCQVAINTVTFDQPDPDQMTMHLQQYFNNLQASGQEDCESLAIEFQGEVCDVTTRFEARR